MSKDTSEQRQAAEEVYDSAVKKHKEQQRDEEEPADENKQPESSKKQEEETDETTSEDDEDDDEEEESESEDELDELFQKMIGKKVNKEGQVIDKKSGVVLGKVVDGKLKRLAGKKVGENGEVKNDKGKVIGRVEPIREVQEEASKAAEKVGDAAEESTEKAKDTAEEPAEKAEDVAEEATDKAKDTAEEAKDTAEEPAEKAEDAAEEATDKADEATEEAEDDADEATEKARDTTEEPAEKAEDAAEEATDKVEDTADEATDKAKDTAEEAEDKADEATEKVKDTAENPVESLESTKDDIKDNIKEEEATDAESAQEDDDNEEKDASVAKPEDDAKEETKERDIPKKEASKEDSASEEEEEDSEQEEETKDKNATKEEDSAEEEDEDPTKDASKEEDPEAGDDKPSNPYELVDENSPEVRKSGKIVDMEDNVIGTIDKKIAPRLAGFKVDPEGNVVNNDGHIVGKAQLYPTESSDEEDKPFNPNENVTEDSPEVRKSGKVVDMEDNIVGYVNKSLAPKFAGFKVDPEGNIIDHDGEIVGQADMIQEPVEEEEKPFNPNPNVDENSPEVRKSGKIVDMEDNIVGTIDKEKAAQFAGLKVDKDGNVIDKDGRVVAHADLFPNEEENKPFNPNENVNEDSPEVRKSGKVVDMEDNVIGTVDKEKAPKLAGFKVDKEGNVINDEGHIVAKAQLYEAEKKPFNPNENVNEDSPEVRKSGKVVDMEDNVIGTVDKEKAPKLAGFKVDKEGNVINDEGHIVAKAQLYEAEEKPFNPYDLVDENSPEVRKSGKVFDMDDNVVGYIDKHLASKLAGFKVDPEGNVVDNDGHIVGRAEMIKEEPEQEEEEEEEKPKEVQNTNVDENSPEVRRSGKVLDMDDNVVGQVDKRLASKFAGFKVDDDGNIVNHEGEVVGSAEMFPKEDKDKPFNPYAMIDEYSPEVKKSGKVVDMDDNIVGYVDKRIASKLAGCKVDNDGNIIDSEGHIAGKAEMFKEEEEEEEPKEEDDKDKPFNPNTMVDEHSPTVRRSGKVIDEDDNVVGYVDKSAAHKLVGFPVDDDGNIINEEGQIVGKAKMVGQKSEEELKKEQEEEEYRKIADQMSSAIQQSLDKIKPVLRQITDYIDEEEAKSEKDRDEEKLVSNVKPLIEQGSSILEEANGAIRGLDPTGRIAKRAQAKTQDREASPEEYHLADLLAQLSGDVSTTIDKAKKKLRTMPHAKKQLNPLWNILQSPLLQILSAVGLLLSGVLGLVGNILNALGLGSIINSLLGGIGLNKILEGFGLADALKLGGKKK